MKIISSPHIPRWTPKIPGMQLSYEFKWCNEDFRQELNEWLLQRFGRRESYFVSKDPFTGEERLMCHPAVAQRLREAIKAEENSLYG